MLEIRLKSIVLKANGRKRARDRVYVMTFGTDLSLESQCISSQGDGQEDMPKGFALLNTYAIVGLSPVVPAENQGGLMTFAGDGLPVYGPKDPGGRVSLHLAVMEYGGARRSFGSKFEEAVNETRIFAMMSGMGRITNHADPRVKLLTDTTRYTFETLLHLLRRDGDEAISVLHYLSRYSVVKNSYDLPEDGRLPHRSDRNMGACLEVTWQEPVAAEMPVCGVVA